MGILSKSKLFKNLQFIIYDGIIIFNFNWFQTNPVCFRTFLLFGSGMVAIFGSSAVGLSGAGPLGCLTTATVAAYKWRKERKPGQPVIDLLCITVKILDKFVFVWTSDSFIVIKCGRLKVCSKRTENYTMYTKFP